MPQKAETETRQPPSANKRLSLSMKSDAMLHWDLGLTVEQGFVGTRPGLTLYDNVLRSLFSQMLFAGPACKLRNFACLPPVCVEALNEATV